MSYKTGRFHTTACTVPEFTYYHDTTCILYMLLRTAVHVLCTVIIVMCKFSLHLYVIVYINVHVCNLNNVMYTMYYTVCTACQIITIQK